MTSALRCAARVVLAFDNPADRGEVHVRQRTYTLRYDAQAAEDAHRPVLALLYANLK